MSAGTFLARPWTPERSARVQRLSYDLHDRAGVPLAHAYGVADALVYGDASALTSDERATLDALDARSLAIGTGHPCMAPRATA